MTTTSAAGPSDPAASDWQGLPHDGFAPRHIGLSPDDVATMLAGLGHDTLLDLVTTAIPATLDPGQRAVLPPALTESEALTTLRARAAACDPGTPLIGMGYAGTVTPQAIMRNLLENPAWYTAYTPYQAEISQGRLEALLHFQTMVCDLTGLDIANASLLDEATAAAEAMALCHRATRGRGDVFAVDADVHPQTLAVVTTRATALGVDVRVVDLDEVAPSDAVAGTFGLLVQYPGSSGQVRDLAPLARAATDAGAMTVAACDPLALAVLVAPGHLGVDVAVGTTQRFGVPLWYGGPHAGFIATTDRHRRSLPGRLVGVSIDANGQAGLRLALQAREQHIRRERATSNICTAQSLPAIVSVAWAIHHGPDGIRAIAERVHDLTSTLAATLDTLPGVEVTTDRIFDTFTVAVADADQVLTTAREHDIELRPVDATHVGISLDETTDEVVVRRVLSAVATATGTPAPQNS